VAIFRGNNRNRRRGFHNTHRFYEQFKVDLPKVAVLAQGSPALLQSADVECFLNERRSEFWSEVHDLPVVEIGVPTAGGIHEWWESTPTELSFDPMSMAETVTDALVGYQEVYLYDRGWNQTLRDRLETIDADVHTIREPANLRKAVLDRLGYDERTVPPHPDSPDVPQMGLTEF
jgi:hypothetical protein